MGFDQAADVQEHILRLRRLIEGFMVKGGGGVSVFIDFRKAFDSLRREFILSLPAAYAVPISVHVRCTCTTCNYIAYTYAI